MFLLIDFFGFFYIICVCVVLFCLWICFLVECFYKVDCMNVRRILFFVRILGIMDNGILFFWFEKRVKKCLFFLKVN